MQIVNEVSNLHEQKTITSSQANNILKTTHESISSLNPDAINRLTSIGINIEKHEAGKTLGKLLVTLGGSLAAVLSTVTILGLMGIATVTSILLSPIITTGVIIADKKRQAKNDLVFFNPINQKHLKDHSETFDIYPQRFSFRC